MTDEDPSHDRADETNSDKAKGFRIPDSMRMTLEALARTQRILVARQLPISESMFAGLKLGGLGQSLKLVEAQNSAAASFAKAINLASLSFKLNPAIVQNSISVGQNFARIESFVKAIDMSKFEHALKESAKLRALSATELALVDTLSRQSEVFKTLARQVRVPDALAFHKNWIKLLKTYRPSNLSELEDLAEVGAVAFEEGIALSWIPRAEIVRLLVDATSREERSAILIERMVDILDDCVESLTLLDDELTKQCKAAISALRAGHTEVAQSHAANIIDSIIVAIPNSRPHRSRMDVIERASNNRDDLPLRIVAEHLTLRPAYRALAKWFPGTGTPPPAQFSRYATAHGVGRRGVFSKESALIAVMFATSLAIQFGQENRLINQGE